MAYLSPISESLHEMNIPEETNSTAITIQDEFIRWTTRAALSVLTTLVLGMLIDHLFSPRLDVQEPPALKSRIPFIGHIIGLIRHQTNFLTKLSAHRMPIASLPMLNGKIYAVWDASLIQAVYRNKNLSFVPFVIEFARKELGYDDAADKIVRESGLMPEFFDAVHEGMAGHYVSQMNVNALTYVAEQLSEITGSEAVVIPNLYLWARDLMTMATCEALYGPENPMRKQSSLLNDIWTFETDLPLLLLGVFPSITARKAQQARARLQTALGEYYAAYGDEHEDAAGITRCRGAVLRKFGVQGADVGIFELALLHVATSNTIPTLFWLLAFIFTRPNLVSRLREEASVIAKQGTESEIVVNVDTLADKCPLLVSSYREVIRLCNKAIGNRRVMADTVIRDGEGHSYLLKEGVNVQMPSDCLHNLEEVWGSDVAEFNAERFLDQTNGGDSNTAKAKRISYVPFGGGKHLCPGRNFAFAENLGLLVSLVLGFDISPSDGNWDSFRAPYPQRCSMAGAVCKPKEDGAGFGISIKRRPGWELTKWKFTSGRK